MRANTKKVKRVGKRKKSIRLWNIRIEEYHFQEGKQGASFLGQDKGTTFKEACIKWFKNNSDSVVLFDSEEMTYFGCRLFDNETDARKTFG